MRKFIPSFSSHLERYVFATDYAFKRKVLDVGSKEGFGAHILSYGAAQVDLCDINQGYLNFAQNYYKFFCPASFIQVDLEKSFPDGEWDTMVAFEVIEHVENPEFLIKNMADHLKLGGFLVCSVPHMVANHEHKTLFDEAKIKELVGKYLTIKEVYTQEFKTISHQPMYKGLKCHILVAEKVL